MVRAFLKGGLISLPAISGTLGLRVCRKRTRFQQQKTFTDELEKQVKERTAELENSNNKLIRMNIELQSFVYVSSQDLQEPLRKMQTFISKLDAEETELPANVKNYFNRISAAAKRMRALIQDLLDYSRTNLADKVFVLTDLQLLAEQVREDCSETISETLAVVEIKELCEVKVITFQFRQLLSNLLGNALKFIQPGVPPHIIITGAFKKASTIPALVKYADKTFCHISISDNGIGFDNQYREKIFEVFHRLHNRDDYPGTGIGLAIVKKIVENHEGIIIASGNVNGGATFDIYIPEL